MLARAGWPYVGLCGLNVSFPTLRGARQPPCPSSRAAASLAAPVEPRAPPMVPRLLPRPRGLKAPWESQRPVSADPCAETAASARSRAQTRRRASAHGFPRSIAHDRQQRRLRSSYVSLPACASSRPVAASRAAVPPPRLVPRIFRCSDEHDVAPSSAARPASGLACHHVDVPARHSLPHRSPNAFHDISNLLIRLLLAAASFSAASKACRLAWSLRPLKGRENLFPPSSPAGKAQALRVSLTPLPGLRSHAARMPRGAEKGRLNRTGG